MNHDNDRQADRGFSSGDDNDEENEHLSLQLAERPAEGNKRQIDGIEHQLDGHENRDDVALEDERHHTQSEQDGAQHQKVRSRNHISPRKSQTKDINQNLRGAPGATRPAVRSRSKST